MGRAEAYREAQPPPHAEAMQAPPESSAGGMPPGDAQPPSGASEAKLEQAEQQRQAETETSRMRSFKAKAAPFTARGANSAPPADATQSVTVAASPQLDTQPAAPAEPVPMPSIPRMSDVFGPGKPIQLPDGLVSVSIAFRGHFLLAVDEAGALFLSEDRGVTWERIATQWTGRAVEVRRRVASNETAPSAQNGTTGNSSPDAGAASQPPVSFELSNDKNQTWVSTDGRTWTPE
jgi:hypothetical protein